MKKISLAIIFTILFLSVFSDAANADSIVLPNGTLTGKINYVLTGLVEIQTAEGLKTINRSNSDENHKDIVLVGFFNKKKITGNVFYLDTSAIEIATSSGNLKINRLKVRDIILYK
ncbi:MAG: hypothetical protein PHC34_11820 [Candidatus Gastranaerophilales bacterium]|nr:hypothetical protein [Candidatus Gastranaerophilales bacterium]